LHIHDIHNDWKDGSLQQGLSDWHNKNNEETNMTTINYQEELARLEHLA